MNYSKHYKILKLSLFVTSMKKEYFYQIVDLELFNFYDQVKYILRCITIWISILTLIMNFKKNKNSMKETILIK